MATSVKALVRGNSEPLWLQGKAGQIEALRDAPEGSSKGTVFICHPYSLAGGNMDHKVVKTLAQAFVEQGWTAIRFNMRGVGKTEGVYDDGIGEADDLLMIIEAMAPTGALALAGFSFGTHVICTAAERIQRPLAHVVLVGTATSRFAMQPIPPAWHERALLIHGEDDDTVPINTTLDWCRPQNLPLLVVPQGGHFFHGQQGLLKNLVLRHLRSA
jgi:hypothetical protein